MKEEVKVATESANVAQEVASVKKVNRRGISSARGTTRLKFSHELAKSNGLFIGHLDGVQVSMITIGEDTTGMPSFNGMAIPKIVFTFASNEEDANKRHYIPLQFTAQESNVDTIPGGEHSWKVDSVLDWIKHILNVYVFKGRELTEEEENALNLDFVDFDEQGEYVAVDSEIVIEAWKKFFENVENILNRGREDKPYYLSAKDNKFIPLWMKLLRYTKTKKKGWTPVNNGELAFPAFVGEGCIEIYKPNTVPSIRINAVKECITPKEIEKAKVPNMPVMPNMGGVPVTPIADPMMGGMDMSGIAAEANSDMPF